jgi:uncharacterized protein (TIGR02594 family)
MKNLLEVAIKEFGTKEIKGIKDNARILQYAKECNFTWINDDETPWCSVFLNWVAKQVNLERSKSAAARSWQHVGFETKEPEPGDIVVFWREHIFSHLGHVGVYLGFSKDHTRVYVLGGNQGDAVSISAYPTERVLSFRRLKNTQTLTLPKSSIRKGARGNQVINLQNILKMLGFSPGTSDGDYGSKTENAIKHLQATKDSLDVSGIYNADTKKYMEELLVDKG